MAELDELIGHRSLPHISEVTVEAWAPTRPRCYAEAVRALVDTFADTSGVVVTEAVPLRIDRASDDEMLVVLLEEVVFLLDVLDMLPAGAAIEEAVDGGLGGTLDLAAVTGATLIGAAPKAVSREGLAFAFDGDVWGCCVTVGI